MAVNLEKGMGISVHGGRTFLPVFSQYNPHGSEQIPALDPPAARVLGPV